MPEETIAANIGSIATMDDKMLLPLLAQTHPGYEVAAKRAKEGLDFYSGERDELVTEEYLPRGNAEEKGEHQKRLSLTEPMPVTPKIVNEVAGAVFDPDPSYDVPPEMDDYLTSANTGNDSHGRVMIDVFCETLAAGFTAVFVDSTLTPEIAADVVITGAKEKELGIRPVLKTYDPRGIRNWGYDNKGMGWIHLCESHVVQGNFQERQKNCEEHLIIDRAVVVKIVVEIKDQGKKVISKEVIPHGLSVVPVKMLAFVKDKKLGPGAGKRYVRTTVRADLAALRANSYRAMGLLIHGTPLLYRRFSEKEWETLTEMHQIEMMKQDKPDEPFTFSYTGAAVKLGQSGLAILQGADSEIGYATVDTGPLDSLKEAEQDYSNRARSEAGFDDADIFGSKANVSAESGISKAFTYSTKAGVQLELLSLIASTFDNAVLELVALKSGVVNPDKSMATYKQPRLVAPFAQLVAELELLEDSGYPPEIIAEAKKRLFGLMILFDGDDPVQRKKLTDLIGVEAAEKIIADKINPANGSEKKNEEDPEQE
jgi:hypothetical protein